jgi:hypothetical protein
MQASWSSPVTNRLLLDAGFGGTYYGWGNMERDPNPTRDLIGVVEQCQNGCAANGGIPGLLYRSQDFGTNFSGSYNWHGSASYVTGALSLKVGYQGTLLTDDRLWTSNNQNLTYRLNNGVPNQLTQTISPYVIQGRADWHAFFVQEQWTFRRLSLQGALRFDVFGNGKTAIKANLGKYLEGAGISGTWSGANPSLRMPGSAAFGVAGVTRTWTDANGNFQPDCDLLNPLANDRRASGGDFCGQFSNLSFGQNILTNNYDPALLTGWGVRSSDWGLGVSVQQQILPRASVEVAYSRRWYHGFNVNDNLLTQPGDYTPYSITAPRDPRLPDGGGYPISGLYDIVPARSGQISTLVTNSTNFGNWYHYFNGVDISLNVRTRGGLTFRGGTSTGQTVADNCDVRASLPELNAGLGAGLGGSGVSTTSPYCHVGYGGLTQLRGLGAYTIPKADVQVSAVFQRKPGALLSANYAVPAATVAQTLGRLPSGNATSVTVNLIQPGSQYGDRLNQLDFRVAKILRFGRPPDLA